MILVIVRAEESSEDEIIIVEDLSKLDLSSYHLTPEGMKPKVNLSTWKPTKKPCWIIECGYYSVYACELILGKRFCLEYMEYMEDNSHGA